jgi:hypothetical protein
MATIGEKDASTVLVVKLTKLNHDKWKREVRAVLGESGLLKFVSDVAAAQAAHAANEAIRAALPGEAAAAAAAGAAAALATAVAERTKKVEEYDRQYHKTVRILLSTASTDIKDQVDDEHPWAIWARYEALCAPRQVAGYQAYIATQLDQVKMASGEAVEAYIQRLKEVRRNYQLAHNTMLADTQINHRFLKGLLESEVWKMFRMVHATSAATHDNLCEQAKLHELNTIGVVKQDGAAASSTSSLSGGASGAAAAMKASDDGNSRKKNSRKKNLTCHECGKKGHFAYECPTRSATRDKSAGASNKSNECSYCHKQGHCEAVC